MKRWIVSYVAAGVGLAGLWFFLIFVPLYKGLERVEMETVESQRQLDDFKKSVNELPGFLESRENLRAQKAALSSRLYSKEDILRLFDQLKLQAQKEDLTITEVTPPIDELLYLNSIVPDSTQLQFLNLSIRLEGKYINFGKFVGRVEQSGYFRGINDCKIMGTKDATGLLQLQLGFTALLGSFKERA